MRIAVHTCEGGAVLSLRSDDVGTRSVATVHARPASGRGHGVTEQGPETRRRARLFATPASFIVTILVIAAIVAVIGLVIYAVGGFGEGSEGALRSLR